MRGPAQALTGDVLEGRKGETQFVKGKSRSL